jgi:hypothetical protein
MNMDLWSSKVGVHFFTSCVVSIVCIVLFSCLSLGMFSWLKLKVFMNPELANNKHDFEYFVNLSQIGVNPWVVDCIW